METVSVMVAFLPAGEGEREKERERERERTCGHTHAHTHTHSVIFADVTRSRSSKVRSL